MTTKKLYKNFPIIAGMAFGKQNDIKLKKVGIKKMEFTYQVFADGDLVLVGEKEVLRKYF